MMNSGDLLLIALAAVLALGFSFFQYLHRVQKRTRQNYWLFALRALAVFFILVLLINPKITSRIYEIEKPELILAVDNSASLRYSQQEQLIQDYVQELQKDENLQENFEIKTYYFGEKISSDVSGEFSENQTDIYAALQQIKDLESRKSSAVVLLSDGNQTKGRDYAYFKSAGQHKLFPVVFGDTATYMDLEISRLNVNRYAYLNNRFPVEVIVNYSGTDAQNSRFVLRSGNAEVYSKQISFSAENTSEIIEFDLPAGQIGLLSYEAEILPLENEKNLQNNRRDFVVEVIDERSRILLLSQLPHPDLGAIKKAIESNEQREVEIQYIEEAEVNLEDFQLVILYQPGTAFRNIFEELKQKNKNYFVISGTKTNWNFLNSAQEFFKKDFTGRNQDFFPVFNPDFSRFQLEDIGFSDFPPLEDRYGQIQPRNAQTEILLFQQIEGIETREPLLMFVTENNQKNAFLFGENLWKWRATIFRRNADFNEFDNFFGKLIQNLASTQKRDRLQLDYEASYYANEKVIIRADYFDENYNFDIRGNLNLSLSRENSEENREVELLAGNNNFYAEFDDLEPGTYEFRVQESGSGISRSGSFRIIDFEIEQQFAGANARKMEALAQNNEGSLYFPTQLADLKSSLLQDSALKPVQKSREKSVPLLEWYYLLFIIAALLAAEWFIRKYRGLI